jgi:hypothetical protein
MTQPLVYSSLDLAKQSGICWGEANGRPEFETWQLGGADMPRGERGKWLMRKLVQHLTDVKPDKVFIEAPLPVHVAARVGSTQDTTIALNGFVFVAETVCHTRGIPTRLIERQDALLFFTGRASYPKSIKDGAKKACLARATQLRWVCANWDEADAGAQWFYGCATEDPKGYALHGVNEAARISRPKTRRKGTLL